MPKIKRKPKAASGGVRDTEGKPAFHLIPPEMVIALARHYQVGAIAHGERNWEKGLSWCGMLKSIMSHSWAWLRGEDYDVATGSHHMICVIWNAAALYAYHIRPNMYELDDRPVEALINKTQPLWRDPDMKALKDIAEKLGVKT